VHPDAALQAMLAGSVRRVMVDAQAVVINMGRTQRLFTGKARQAAQLLAVRCGFRGCDVAAEFCDVDHVTPWVDGGETDQANSLPLCGSHDRRKHGQQLRGRRDRHGRIHLIRPDGSVIKPLNAHDPEWTEAGDDVGDGQACPSTIDAAGRTRNRLSAAAVDAARKYLRLSSERTVVEVFVRRDDDGPSRVDRAKIVSDCSTHFNRLSRCDVNASRSELGGVTAAE
jgi:hypothetical protein